MEDKVNYTAVGAFVLVLGAALLAGVLWLAAGLGRRQAVDPYQAFIQESVAGLNVEAPVKYLGVDVGKVSRIEVDPGNPRQVRLRFLVARGTPIMRDTVAVLKSQGLTGIAYVELSGGSAGAQPLRPGAEGEVPTIPFKPSLSARLENVLTSVLANVDRVSNNLNAVFDADNRAALKGLLADSAALAGALAAQRTTLAAGITDAARAAHLAAGAGAQLGPALDRIAAASLAVQRMADAAGAASARVGQAADTAASGVQQLGSEALPGFNQLTAELSELSASLRRLSEQTTGSPSSLLLGSPATPPGPGEARPP